jgi:hypothetical protein
MLTLVLAYALPVLASLLIGLATARWTFRRPSTPDPRSGTDAQ